MSNLTIRSSIAEVVFFVYKESLWSYSITGSSRHAHFDIYTYSSEAIIDEQENRYLLLQSQLLNEVKHTCGVNLEIIDGPDSPNKSKTHHILVIDIKLLLQLFSKVEHTSLLFHWDPIVRKLIKLSIQNREASKSVEGNK